jgi:hypothetical protein
LLRVNLAWRNACHTCHCRQIFFAGSDQKGYRVPEQRSQILFTQGSSGQQRLAALLMTHAWTSVSIVLTKQLSAAAHNAAKPQHSMICGLISSSFDCYATPICVMLFNQRFLSYSSEVPVQANLGVPQWMLNLGESHERIDS